jgi:hypothetical protein
MIEININFFVTFNIYASKAEYAIIPYKPAYLNDG